MTNNIKSPHLSPTSPTTLARQRARSDNRIHRALAVESQMAFNRSPQAAKRGRRARNATSADHPVSVRLTAQERDHMAREARKLGISLSEWIRLAAMGTVRRLPPPQVIERPATVDVQTARHLAMIARSLRLLRESCEALRILTPPPEQQVRELGALIAEVRAVVLGEGQSGDVANDDADLIRRSLQRAGQASADHSA
jgi:hypothetical protein